VLTCTFMMFSPNRNYGGSHRYRPAPGLGQKAVRPSRIHPSNQSTHQFNGSLPRIH
jgi:hypothetical protein